MRDKYGSDNFGQGCLLARRLVENKVRFVEVSYGGWDMHNDVFGNMETRGAVLDAGLSSLLEDLNVRGLLNDTMVVVASEFGRTPEIKSGRVGRDHHPSAFSAFLLAEESNKVLFMESLTKELITLKKMVLMFPPLMLR